MHIVQTNHKPNHMQTNHSPKPVALHNNLENAALVKALETAISTANGPSKNRFDRLTDDCVKALSTPTAIWLQSVAIGTYVLANTLVVTNVIRFDPYPFLFLNTLFSLLSAYTTVFVLNSNRRQDLTAKATEKAELAIYKKILADLAVLKGENNDPQK